jgi:hypothetical protein
MRRRFGGGWSWVKGWSGVPGGVFSRSCNDSRRAHTSVERTLRISNVPELGIYLGSISLTRDIINSLQVSSLPLHANGTFFMTPRPFRILVRNRLTSFVKSI